MRPSKSKAEPWGDEQLDWALDPWNGTDFFRCFGCRDYQKRCYKRFENRRDDPRWRSRFSKMSTTSKTNRWNLAHVIFFHILLHHFFTISLFDQLHPMIATHQGYLVGFCKDLDVEGMGVAMLDMQLDTRESHELGYGSLKFLRATRPRGWFWCVQMGQQWICKGEGISKSHIQTS